MKQTTINSFFKSEKKPDTSSNGNNSNSNNVNNNNNKNNNNNIDDDDYDFFQDLDDEDLGIAPPSTKSTSTPTPTPTPTPPTSLSQPGIVASSTPSLSLPKLSPSKLNLKNIKTNLINNNVNETKPTAETINSIPDKSNPEIKITTATSKLSLTTTPSKGKIDSFFKPVSTPSSQESVGNNSNNNLFSQFEKEEKESKSTSTPSRPKRAASAKITNNNNINNNTRKRKTIDVEEEEEEQEEEEEFTQLKEQEQDTKMELAEDTDTSNLDDFKFDSSPTISSSSKVSTTKSLSSVSSTSTTKSISVPSTPSKNKKKPMDDDDFDFEDDQDMDTSSPPLTPKKSSSSTSVPSTPSKNKFGKLSKKETEERLSFLVDIKDSLQRGKDDPNYDPRTLYIPKQAMAKFTPFERQFWEIKSKHYDTVVFFKKGKFYELYENDADIGHQLLHLKMTDRVNMRMVGVPESSFNQWSSKLIQLGYKVAKVDQMETSIGASKRQSEKGGAGKTDSIITRELTSILTAGTLLDETLISDHNSTYLMSIKHDDYNKQFGICFVDVSIGSFFLSTFTDDNGGTQLETLLLQTMPKEIIYEKNAIGTEAMNLLKRVLAPVKPIMNARDSLTEYLDPLETLAKIKEIRGCIPDDLNEMKNDTMALSALGACVSYLMDIRIGKGVLDQARFKYFNPLDVENALILDGQCLVNLEIFNNSTDGSSEGTLYKLMDRCSTAFGKRMFRQWICRPLANKALIQDRQNAIDHLKSNPSLMQSITALLLKLPDLERMISRIKSKSSKIQDLISVLNHFESIHNQIDSFENIDKIASNHLKSCLLFDNNQNNNIDNNNNNQDDGDEEDLGISQEKKTYLVNNISTNNYPNLSNHIEKVRESFEYDRENDQIIPSKGLFKEFDDCQEKIKAYEDKLDTHLQEQKEFFGSNKLDYKHMGKEIYQLEVPVAIATKKKLGSEYQIKSHSKVVNRYHTPFICKVLPKLLEERDTLDVLSREILKKIQENFSTHFSQYMRAVQCLAQLDCILSLYKVSTQSTIPMCRPEFLEAPRGFLQIKDMRHPCISSKATDEFIPNDLSLNTTDNPPSVMVLTGPNMGGKSTLLRQTCLLVIMAQLGCYVPATQCSMSIVDRIFTRLGANDNILAGQSTFMVELQETCNVLKHATNRSLVILDELGRGTSTFDGYSIAYSVLNYIAHHIESLCIFATHYQSLANEPAVIDKISTSYMTCQVDEEQKKVVFLYKLAKGICENSYGLHVASMTGLPKSIIAKAEEKAKQFEKESTISSYIHGTIHKSELVKRIASSFASKDIKELILLQKTLLSKNNIDN
ncbi:hypothetical protein CYY_000958 [Polysphondylium violaceum]|uniref:DNA mismatch repair protein n=1 Tax=Polysphondylium violaceum TaxID=133409 RepID=A0A8J4Q9X7_9MYCE|nr:hypothetical protein CYY_000958 [Polysphondylium violaceum]